MRNEQVVNFVKQVTSVPMEDNVSYVLRMRSLRRMEHVVVLNVELEQNLILIILLVFFAQLVNSHFFMEHVKTARLERLQTRVVQDRVDHADVEEKRTAEELRVKAVNPETTQLRTRSVIHVLIIL